MASPSAQPALRATLEPGSPLLPSLQKLCLDRQIEEGRVLVRGPLSALTIRATEASAPLELDGALLCVSGEGWLLDGAMSLHAVVSWSGPGVPGVIAGVVEAGTAERVEVVIEPWSTSATTAPSAPSSKPRSKAASSPAPSRPARRATSSRKEAAVDLSPEMESLGAAPSAPGSTKRAVEIKAAPTPAPEPTGGGWATAVAVSKATQSTGSPKRSSAASRRRKGVDPVAAGGDELRIGDILLHPSLGPCRVSTTVERDKFKVRLKRGQLKELTLRALRLIRQPDEDGSRVFKVLIGRR